MLEVVAKGFILGIFSSVPVLVFNYYVCKRLDKIIQTIEEIDCKLSK